MVNPTRTTTVNYRFNPKIGDYQPQSMVVVVTEELDRKAELEAQAAEQAELKAKFELQEVEASLPFKSKEKAPTVKDESKEDAFSRHIASRVV